MATLLRPRRARSAGELAAATPDSRERPVDLLRAVAIVTVVVGHWLAVTVVVLDGTVTGESVLRVLPWTHPLTWIFQVMPVFFLVGGYANAASWTTAQDRGVGWVGWLTARGDRLLRPTTLFVAVGAGGCALARLGGLDPRLAQRAGWLVAISLWFLAVYLAVVALTPAMLALHRRCGLGVPFALGVAVAVVDVLRLGFDVPAVGGLNFGLVWLAVVPFPKHWD